MRCLVTGCAGFIGSHLSERLISLGHEVVGVDRFADYYPRPAKERNLQGLLRSPAFRLVEADLASVEVAPLLAGVEVVFHLAAQAGVRASWGESFSAYTQDNILSTQRLLEASRAAGVRKVVYASSSSVYGETPDLPMRESSLPRPYSPYGVSKLAAEHLVELYRTNFGLPSASLRYFTVYGPRQRPDMGFHRFVEALRLGRPLPLFGDGQQTREFTYVSDIVEANLLAMEDGKDGVFNIGGGSTVKLNEALQLMHEQMGVPWGGSAIERLGAQAGDVTHTVADLSKAQSVLGYAPRVSLRQGLEAQIAWHRERARAS